MKKRAVILDFDGTMADTSRLVMDSWQHTFRTLTGKEGDPAYIISTFGEPLRASLIRTFPDHDVEEALAAYRGFQLAQPDASWILFPGVREMMQALRDRGYLVGVVTSRTKITCLKGLAECGIEDMIDALVTCDDTQVHKPDPAPANIGLAKLGVRPEEALFVGDTWYDIDCAHNAGIDAAVVDWSLSMSREDMEGPRAPEFYIEKPEDILAIMESC